MGSSRLVLDNGGTIQATGSSSLFVELSGTSSVNTGIMEAGAGGDLQFVKGAISNQGTFQAYGANSSLEFDRSAVILNNSGGTLSGGTWNANAGGTVSLTGGVITTDAAAITLSGVGSVFQSGTGTSFTTLQKSLTTIAAGGSLSIGNVPYTFANAIALNGTLNVSSPPNGQGNTGSFTSGLITASAGSLISDYGGNGTIASSLTDAGTVYVGNYSGLIFTGAKDTFSGSFTSSTSVLGQIDFTAGIDTLAKGVTLSNSSTVINGAKVVLGATLTDNGNLSMSSGTLSLGAYSLTVAGALNGTTPLGTSAFSGGTVTGPGTLTLGAKTTSTFAGVTFSGASLSNSGNLSVTGALTLSGASGVTDKITNVKGATFALADGTSIGVAAGVTGAFTNAGTLIDNGTTGQSVIGTAITNTGTIEAAGGTLDLAGALSSTGTVKIDAGATLILGGTVAKGGTVSFAAGTGGTLTLAKSQTFASTIAGFAAGDVLDLSDLAYGNGAAPTATFSGSTLTVSNGTTSETFTLASATATAFNLSKDSTGGTMVTGAIAAPSLVTTAPGTATSSKPFAGVSLSDPNASAKDSISIAVTGNGGTLGGTGLSGGEGGVYNLAAGTPSAVTTNLDALTFTPKAVAANSAASTTFTLTDTSSAGTKANPDVLTQTIGNGNGLTITAVAGQDTITGNGSGEAFVFNAGFGHASITDFSTHVATMAPPDTISLPSAEFANFAAMLADTTQSGSAPALITAANGDQLALPNMTVATINMYKSDFSFHA